jgi:hypothetical protein
MGFTSHYDNMTHIVSTDVITPSIGGAGSTGLAKFVIELGLPYGDLNRDSINADGSITETTDQISARIRPPLNNNHAAGRTPARILKTHLPCPEFSELPARGCWILVRDPRDALYSWYRYHQSFAEAEWERVPDSFDDFLGNPFFMGGTPVENWWMFYQGWLDWSSQPGRRLRIIRFEDLKADPVACMRSALEITGARFTDGEITAAAKESSYQAMRRRENELVGGASTARVTRSGKPGEWKDWMTPRLREHFNDDELWAVARRFGYGPEG